jgi:hypothetical protein
MTPENTKQVADLLADSAAQVSEGVVPRRRQGRARCHRYAEPL